MKTAVVVSDTHGNRRFLESIDGVLSEADYIIHLGDTSADGSFLCRKYPEKTHVINGNCDMMPSGENEMVLKIEDVKIFACHGHLYSVKSTLTRLALKAKQEGCALALYGHTHEARESLIDGVTIVNPGNGTRYGQPSYLYLVVNGNKFTHKIVRI